MQIVYKDLSWLKPYKNNPRKNEEAVEPVANSIKKFGFKVPIVATSDGEVINGHTRLKASKMLGLDEVPVIIADDLDEEQIRAFRLADNKVGEIAEWDSELMNLELDEITNIDMSDFGFDFDTDVFEKDTISKLSTEPEEINDKSVLIVEAESDLELEKLYNEFIERGIQCRVSIL